VVQIVTYFVTLMKDKKGIDGFVVTAFLIPIVMLLVMIVFQLMVTGADQLAVNEAAFEAARSAARSSTPYQTALTTAQNFGSGFIYGWKNNVTVTMPQVPNQAGDPLTVQVTFPVPQFFKPLATPTVKGSSTQILEELP
jgi:Flp pilus assembly protein TadG